MYGEAYAKIILKVGDRQSWAILVLQGIHVGKWCFTNICGAEHCNNAHFCNFHIFLDHVFSKIHGRIQFHTKKRKWFPASLLSPFRVRALTDEITSQPHQPILLLEKLQDAIVRITTISLQLSWNLAAKFFPRSDMT